MWGLHKKIRKIYERKAPMIKIFCDRCGRELPDHMQVQRELTSAKFTNGELALLELCSPRESELRFFLRGEDNDAESYRD
jgi:hypothetical protein